MKGDVLTSEEYFCRHWADSVPVQTLVESVVLALEARQAEQALREVAGAAGDKKSRQRRWMSDDDLAVSLQTGTVLRGQLQVDEYRPEEAWVRVSQDSSRPNVVDLFLPTRAHRGRSIHGDMVAVQPLPREEWRRPSYRLPRRSAAEEGSEKKGAAGEARDTETGAEGACPTGMVVGVIESANRVCVATIEDDVTLLREGTTAAVLAVPMDLRLPKLRLRTRRASTLGDCRLVLAIDDWSIDSTYPAAHIVRVLGASGGVDVESEAILVEVGDPPTSY